MRGLGVGAIVLIALSVLANLAGTLSDWHTYLVVRDYLGYLPGVTEADLRAADLLSQRVAVAGPAALAAAGIGFLRWLWWARTNTAWARHRYPRMWAVAAWFCPIVNLWHPAQVVSDVWRASSPTSSPTSAPSGAPTSAPSGAPTSAPSGDTAGAPSRGGRRGRRLLVSWWLCWVASGLIDTMLLATYPRSAATPESLRATALLSSLSSASYLVAAVLLAVIVLRISRWQDPPRWRPGPASRAEPAEPEELVPIVD
jgi:hypothetical protein